MTIGYSTTVHAWVVMGDGGGDGARAIGARNGTATVARPGSPLDWLAHISTRGL
jgi:hypothetical protein